MFPRKLVRDLMLQHCLRSSATAIFFIFSFFSDVRIRAMF